jgi:hypothetical protein
MGITKRHARFGIGKRPHALKLVTPLKLVLGAIALLMVSGVLAASGGGYGLDPWAVPSGGAISSSGGGYSLGSTAGQTGAGTVSGGGYTLYGGFWRPGTIVKAPAVPIYVPAILKSLPPTPVPTPVVSACNDVENNDTPQQARPLTTIGGTCIGSLQDDPQGEDDWYSLDLAPGQTITIDLTGIPSGGDYDLALHNVSNAAVASSTKANNTDEHLTYTNSGSAPAH